MQQYTELIGLIIRPQRQRYDVEMMGQTRFFLQSRAYHRVDLSVCRARTDSDKRRPPNLSFASESAEDKAFAESAAHEPDAECRIEMSFFGPVGVDCVEQCVIYCHGNSGCRLEAMETVQVLLPCGIAVVAVDFCGSGLSSGDFVTLGWNERKDLDAVIAFLRNPASPVRANKIALWGRSMGAVTALFSARDDPSIAGLVLDSAYSDLPALCRELVGQVINFPVPGFAVSAGLRIVRSSVTSRAGVDINDLTPISFVSEVFVPALFVHGKQDTFVVPTHSKALHEAYGGDKTIMYVAGDHNAQRPRAFMERAVVFLCNVFGMTAQDIAPRSRTITNDIELQSALKESAASRAEHVLEVVRANKENGREVTDGLSVRDMKLTMRHLDVFFGDCVEKQEMVERFVHGLYSQRHKIDQTETGETQ